MAQVKALRLSKYCISISSLHYHLSELINIAQTPNNFSTLRVYKIMSHRGAMNHFQHNRNFLRRVQRTKSLLITESAAIRIDYNLARVYYFTHTTQGPYDSPNRPKLDKGVLASTVPNKTRSLNLTPSLRVEIYFHRGHL